MISIAMEAVMSKQTIPVRAIVVAAIVAFSSPAFAHGLGGGHGANKPTTTTQATKTKPPSSTKKSNIEVTDYGFGVSMPVTTSRSDGGGATVGK